LAGKQLGFNDPRGKLWEDTIRVIKKSQPKAFICENAKGMLTQKSRPAFNYILEQFDEAGYDCSFQVLNSKFFGVPQNRERGVHRRLQKRLRHQEFQISYWGIDHKESAGYF
jgi:DNA (cytosine-5)-methyltransferase 1